jgi:hypothetical protein
MPCLSLELLLISNYLHQMHERALNGNFKTAGLKKIFLVPLNLVSLTTFPTFSCLSFQELIERIQRHRQKGDLITPFLSFFLF